MIEEQKVTYYAVSIFSSKTFWVNAVAFLIAVLSSSEVLMIIPLKYMPLYSMVIAALNVYLRTATVRPVALIAPGETKAIEVPRIGPPPPAKLTD